ncbi:MAG TPA: hypothetical protein VHX66_05330 [Solirubrobacteraceae bacterium]|jgi:hypothetical protein|nr:hypothetical protein [Solirubrobacteraceae bacterium]
MHAHGVYSTGWDPIHLASLSSIHVHVWEWVQAIWTLAGGGYVGGVALTVLSALAAGLAVVAVAAVLAGLRNFPGSFETTFARDGGAAGNSPARTAYVTAWFLSSLLISAAFVMSTAPQGDTSQRYLVGVPIALAALIPLLARRRLVIATVTIAASIYCLNGLASLATLNTTQSNSFTRVAAAVTSLAGREHVSYGYSDYWNAAPLTLDSKFNVSVYPVMTCKTGLCRFPSASLSAFYRVQPHTRSFLLTYRHAYFLRGVPKKLGPPAAKFSIDGSYGLLVYDYDIASRINSRWGSNPAGP